MGLDYTGVGSMKVYNALPWNTWIFVYILIRFRLHSFYVLKESEHISKNRNYSQHSFYYLEANGDLYSYCCDFQGKL